MGLGRVDKADRSPADLRLQTLQRSGCYGGARGSQLNPAFRKVTLEAQGQLLRAEGQDQPSLWSRSILYCTPTV